VAWGGWLEKMIYAIGIDPGKTGAAAMLDSTFQLIGCEDCPVIKTVTKPKKKGGRPGVKNEFAVASMSDVLRTFLGALDYETNQVRAFLERASPMPKQGLSSTFSTGRGWGIWEGIVAGLGLSYEIVSAVVWQKVMFRGTPLGDSKSRSLARVQRLFPTLSLKKPGGRVLSMDGRSDAVLIAYWGMMQMLNQEDPAIPPKQPVRKKK
jgi:hypothetical protein